MLDEETMAALREYAAKHGRTWRAKLRADFMRAHRPGSGSELDPALMRLRNRPDGHQALRAVKL